jgi:Leucine-rich repeat (LRR) protein
MRQRLAAIFLGSALAATAALSFGSPAQADETATPSATPAATASASPSATPTASPDVAVPDAAFLACLNKQLKQSDTAKVTEAQLAGITSLVCSGSADTSSTWIASLTGAEKLTALTKLTLEQSQLETLKPIEGLTKLTELQLNNNHDAALTDLSPLAKLTALTGLTISRTQASDLSPLKGLTKLTSLIVTQTRVANLTPLKDLTALTELILASNRIESVTALSNLKALTKLDLSNNVISDVTGLAGLTALEASTSQVLLSNNKLTDLSVLGANYKPRCSSGQTCTEGGVYAVGQAATLTAKVGEEITPVKALASNTSANNLNVTIQSGDATVKDGKVTFKSPGTVVIDWTDKSTVTVATAYFAGQIVVTVADPAKPASCGVTGKTPLSGPSGTFLDVFSVTPHYDDVKWLADEGWSTGWSVSCYKTTDAAWHVVTSGSGYTLSDGRYDANYGIKVDGSYEVNEGTIGYVFQPMAQVTRVDSTVWLAKLALGDLKGADGKALDLASPDAMQDFLNGPYAITDDDYTQGADGKWGTDDDPKVVTFPVGHKYYAEFTDIKPSFGQAVTDRHGNAVAWLANTVVNAKFDKDGNLINGTRLSEGFDASSGTTAIWAGGDTWTTAKATPREFRPYASIARQDMAAFLYRVGLFEQQTGEHSKVNMTVSKEIPGYTAHAESVKWLAGAGITEGYADGSFGGLLPVYRQDMAAFLHRADKFINL